MCELVPGNPDNSSWHPYVNERDDLCNQEFAEAVCSTCCSNRPSFSQIRFNSEYFQLLWEITCAGVASDWN